MAQLIVRGVEDEVKRRLQARAHRHGHSMEAEVREILQNVLKDEGQAEEEGLGTRIEALFVGIGLRPGELEPLPWDEIKSPFAE